MRRLLEAVWFGFWVIVIPYAVYLISDAVLNRGIDVSPGLTIMWFIAFFLWGGCVIGFIESATGRTI